MEVLKVSRSAIARAGKQKVSLKSHCYRREFDISLTHTIKGGRAFEKRSSEDSKAKKWHYLVILYLFSILVYIGCLCLLPPFLSGWLPHSNFFFMLLFYELGIFIKEKMQKEE